MKKMIFTVFSLILAVNVFSQNCNCEKDYDFVIEKIENEHPGFKLNVTNKNIDNYRAVKKEIRLKIKDSVVNDIECAKLIKKYLSLIKDKHLSIYSSKIINDSDYEKKILTQKLPFFKEINASVNYIKIPSFNYRLWKKLDNFYDSITPLVTSKQKLILDIRDNSGGGERMYKQLLKLIKKEKKIKHVIVLYNKNCASACEEVALKLNDYEKVTSMGENTNGQFAYGFIKGLKTPNCNLSFIITTKKYPKRLKYEYVGVAPDINLDNENNWIAYAINYLKIKYKQ